ncbi:arylamine N-acetyltransferase [Rhizobium hidalgonense]|nr:arylamine N-acetyltransferase [Rhizobium hidalgonense]
MEGIETDGNHGTVVVCLGGCEYLVDAQLAALPLVAGRENSTGNGIHDIRAVPVGERFDIRWYPGSNRQTPMVTRLELKRGPVDHGVFLAQYALSALRHRNRSPFNDALFVGRHFPDRIVNVGRTMLTEVSAKNIVSSREIEPKERTEILVDIFGISPEVVARIPPDETAAS